MVISFSVLTLVAVLAITLFIIFLDISFWRAQRADRTLLWLIAWLSASVIFLFCRLMQFASLSDPVYIILPRVIMTAGYSLAWLGYELANSFINRRPSRRERSLFIFLVAVPIVLLWTSELIWTRDLVVRLIPHAGLATGVTTGSLFIPLNLLILVLGAVPALRLFRAPSAYKRENLLMGLGLSFLVLFNLYDIIVIFFGAGWIRLSDYSYLPVAVFFSYINAQRFGLLYREMSSMVDARTAELRQTNAILRSSENKFSTAFRTSPDSININRLSDGLYIEINDGFTTLTGYTAEDVRGKTSFELDVWANPEDRARLVEGLREHGEVTNMEAGFRLKDGSVKIGLMSARIIQIDGETCTLSITRDINDLKRAEEEIRRTAEEMTALYQTTHDLVIDRDLPKLLYTIVERAARLLQASGGGLYLCEPERRQVRCVVSYQTKGDYTGTILKYGEGAAGMIAETGEPLIIEDYRIWEKRARTYEEEQPFISLLSVPMQWQDQVIGVIHILDNSRAGAFDVQDLRILTLFADQAAIAITNARLFESEQRRRQEAAAIAEVGRDISASLQLDVVLELIASRAKDLLRAETSAVYLHEPGQPIMRAIAALGPDSDQIKQDPLLIGDGILGDIAVQKVGEIVNDDANDPRAITVKGTEDIPIEHLMGVPVMSRDRLAGLIAVWRIGEGQEYEASDLDFLTSLAQQAAIAIENASLFAAEQNRRKESETLRHAAQRITGTLDQEQVIQLILDQLAKVVPYESASVQLLGDGYLEIIGGQGWPDPAAVLGIRFPVPGDNPNTLVIQRRSPLILGEVMTQYSPFKDPPHSHIHSWLGVPLIVRDQVIGMFAVDHSQPNFFTEEDAEMVNALAGQAAIAIENTRLFEEAQKRLREIEGVANVSAALSRTLELGPLLETILRSIIHAIPPAERGAILLADEDGSLRTQATWGFSDERIRDLVFPPDSNYTTIYTLNERHSLLIGDVRADPVVHYEGDIQELLTEGSAIASPLIVKGRAIGVVIIDAPGRLNAFDENDLHLLESLTSPAALAIENARLFEDTRHRLTELEIIQTIASALRIAQTLDEIFPIILDQLISLLDFDSAMVDLLDTANGEIVSILARGAWTAVTGMRTSDDVGVSSRVIATGQPYTTTDVVADGVIARPDLAAGINAVACVPIVAQHQPIGTLWVGRLSRTAMTAEEVNLLFALGEMMGSTVQRMRLYEQTMRQAQEISLAYDLTLEGWAKALELRDKETEGHSRRVTELTMYLARRFGIPESEMTHIHRGVLLHDIGKMGVPDHILKKPGPLNDEEWAEMRRHPQYAYDLIHPIDYLRPALDIPYCHHERWDGSGYPRGLEGEQIPLAARIFAVVDVYDALSCDRPYRAALSREEVLAYLQEHAGTFFDPQVVEAFLASPFEI